MATGNTFSNFFHELKQDDCIANIFCRNEAIDNSICKHYYKVTEQDIIKNLFKKNHCGNEIEKDKNTEQIKPTTKQESVYRKKLWSSMQKLRPSFLLFFREMIWNLGIWKSSRLDSFLLNYKPDIIYMHGHNNLYMHKILWYCQKITNAKVALFFGDDMYNSKGERYLKKIYHQQLQSQLKYSIDHADIVFGGSPMLCEEYSRIFNKKFTLQIKTCGNLIHPKEHKYVRPLEMVYAGNLLYGREQVLEEISDVIREINKDRIQIILKIFSTSVVDSVATNKLNDNTNCFLCGPRKYSEIVEILENCDICLFPESSQDVYKKITSLSFSTKIIDYMESPSALLSYGPSDVSSINYIESSKIGYSANDRQTLKRILVDVIDSPQLLRESIIRKYGFALEHHSKSTFLESVQSILD